MRRTGGGASPAVRALSIVAAALVGVLLTMLPAVADQARPTVDPSAPTPTAPIPGGPPQGHGPDGRTVGGEKLSTRGVVVADGAPPLPDGVAAAGWLVADAGTGQVLAARDPHGRYYPASTLKTLTLLTLAHLLDPKRVVVGTDEDANIEGSRVGLVPGGQYPVWLLFQALILQSGNDAANALARAAGGVAVTVRAMNETAEDIGAYDTVAGTPSGLDVAGQSCSPYDLALIFRALVADPVTEAVLTTPSAQMPMVPGRSYGYQIQSQNPLLTGYPGDLGGKNGFTDAARHTFVTAAERNGRRLVVSLMDTEAHPLRAPDQAVRLLDWGFSVPAGTHGVGTLVKPGEVTAAPSSPASSSPASSSPASSSSAGASAAAARTDRPAISGAAARSSVNGFPVLPVTLAAGAVVLVAAAVLGRRRALRPAPVRRSGGGPVPPTPPAGESPSTRP